MRPPVQLSRRFLAPLIVALGGLPAAAQTISWPERCPVADLHRGLPAPTPGLAAPAIAWPAHDQAAAWRAGAWSAWARGLRRTDGPERSEEAAVAALAQSRSRSAWRHWSRLAEQDPARAATLFPRLLPGVRGPYEVTPEGRLAPLPADVLLAPAVPPRVEASGRINFRRVTLEDLAVGETHFALELVVRGDGVQAEFRHLSGPAATVRFRMPVPAESELDSLYADWEEQPDPSAPIRVRLEPSQESFRCWARTSSSPLAWPGLPVGEPDARLRTSGLELLVPAGDPWTAELKDLAAGLSELLSIRVFCVHTPSRAAAQPSPIRAWLPPLDTRELWLRDLVEAAENFALTDRDG